MCLFRLKFVSFGFKCVTFRIESYFLRSEFVIFEVEDGVFGREKVIYGMKLDILLLDVVTMACVLRDEEVFLKGGGVQPAKRGGRVRPPLFI